MNSCDAEAFHEVNPVSHPVSARSSVAGSTWWTLDVKISHDNTIIEDEICKINQGDIHRKIT